jgi:hypothetical protein
MAEDAELHSFGTKWGRNKLSDSTKFRMQRNKYGL